MADSETLLHRIAAYDWPAVCADLDGRGWALLPKLLSKSACDAVAALYAEEARFRKTVVMARHGYGLGAYRYFDYPLPDPVARLRGALYPHLAPLANRWAARLRQDISFPPEHAAFLERCHAAGQKRATPLILDYAEGGYNCLHQDLYGEHVFPLQAAVLLDQPGKDFEGGEFVLTEQRPRRQSRAQVVPLAKGDAVVFAVNHRPAEGKRGAYRVAMRHGVSELRAGHRRTLGIIFHDAKS
ncbi:MAG: 2OG-Fe(II) oxygenase [Rhodovibrionaceae bacterium]